MGEARNRNDKTNLCSTFDRRSDASERLFPQIPEQFCILPVVERQRGGFLPPANYGMKCSMRNAVTSRVWRSDHSFVTWIRITTSFQFPDVAIITAAGKRILYFLPPW